MKWCEGGVKIMKVVPKLSELGQHFRNFEQESISYIIVFRPPPLPSGARLQASRGLRLCLGGLTIVSWELDVLNKDQLNEMR